MQETTRDLILRLRRIKEQKHLSVSMIADMVKENGDHISDITITRVFTEGNEERNFRYYDTLQPIAKVLLKLDQEEEGISDEEQATKDVALIKDMEYKILMEQNVKLEERVKYLEERVEYLKEQVAIHQAAIERKDEQISARDKSIQKRDEIIERFSKCTLNFIEAIHKEEDPVC